MNTSVSRVPQLRGNHAIAVYDIDYIGDELVATGTGTQNAPFDYLLYSRFKYGQKSAADTFAREIARTIEPHLWPALDYKEPIVVTGTPYKRIPNAAQALAINTFRRLSRTDGLNVSYASIYQPRLAVGDYSKLSQADRDRRNQQKTRAFDSSDFEGRHVLLIDDVRITGSIERSTVAMLANVPTLSITCVNLVRLNPATALERPQLEHDLNHSFVKGLRSLWTVMNSPDGYAFTTRALKFFLEAPLGDICDLVEWMTPAQLSELHLGIIQEGYDQMPEYAESLSYIDFVTKARFRD